MTKGKLHFREPGSQAEIQGGVSVEDDGAVGWVLVFKNQRNPYRAFNERKREPQDPGLHVYIYMCV